MAPRDIVSRAIFDYAKKSNTQVYLSFKTFEYSYFKQRFPNIENKFASLGYNLPHDRVPISPAFHYAIGGIKTDLNGSVPSVKGLYAVGESASTGVHGANRLASNSLLEGLVFAARAAKKIVELPAFTCKIHRGVSTQAWWLKEDKAKKDRLRTVMWENVSIVRTKAGLQEALQEINGMLSQTLGRMLYLRLLTAKEIVTSALKRETSVGVHYREN